MYTNGLLDVQPNFHKKKWSKHVHKLPGIFKGPQLKKKKGPVVVGEHAIVTGLKSWIMFLTWYKTNRSIAAWKDTKIERTWTYRLIDYHSNGIPISMGNTSTNSGCSWIFRVPCRGCFSKTWPCSQKNLQFLVCSRINLWVYMHSIGVNVLHPTEKKMKSSTSLGCWRVLFRSAMQL